MPQQLTLDLVQAGEKTEKEYMLWYHEGKVSPEQAIKNACQYFLAKYGNPGRVVLPGQWQANNRVSIKAELLEEALGLIVDTSPMVQPRHIAVYPISKDEE